MFDSSALEKFVLWFMSRLSASLVGGSIVSWMVGRVVGVSAGVGVG